MSLSSCYLKCRSRKGKQTHPESSLFSSCLFLQLLPNFHRSRQFLLQPIFVLPSHAPQAIHRDPRLIACSPRSPIAPPFSSFLKPFLSLVAPISPSLRTSRFAKAVERIYGAQETPRSCRSACSRRSGRVPRWQKGGRGDRTRTRSRKRGRGLQNLEFDSSNHAM